MDKDIPITEGTATIYGPKGEVFYNPVQVFNRDLSIAVINEYIKLYRFEKFEKERKWRRKFLSRSFNHAINNITDIHPSCIMPMNNNANQIWHKIITNIKTCNIIHPGCIILDESYKNTLAYKK